MRYSNLIALEPLPGRLLTAMAAFGVPLVEGEVGGRGQTKPENVAYYVERALDVARLAGILGPRQPDTVSVPPRTWRLGSIESVASGIFQREVELGQSVTSGDRLGTVRDGLGRIVAEVRAPTRATIGGYRDHAASPPATRCSICGCRETASNGQSYRSNSGRLRAPPAPERGQADDRQAQGDERQSAQIDISAPGKPSDERCRGDGRLRGRGQGRCHQAVTPIGVATSDSRRLPSESTSESLRERAAVSLIPVRTAGARSGPGWWRARSGVDVAVLPGSSRRPGGRAWRSTRRAGRRCRRRTGDPVAVTVGVTVPLVVAMTVEVGVLLPAPDDVGVEVGVPDPTTVTVGVSVTDALDVIVAVGVSVTDAPGVTVVDGVAVVETVAVGVSVTDPTGDDVAVTEPVVVAVKVVETVAVEVSVVDPAAVGVGVAVVELTAVGVVVADPVGVAVVVTFGVTVAVGVSLAENVSVGLGVSDDVGVGDVVALILAVAVTVADTLAIGVDVTLALAVDVGVAVAVVDVVGVAVLAPVAVGVPVETLAVAVGVSVADADGVDVVDPPAVGVAVAVVVGVAVPIRSSGVAVRVAVVSGVAVGVADVVAVGLSVAVWLAPGRRGRRD